MAKKSNNKIIQMNGRRYKEITNDEIMDNIPDIPDSLQNMNSEDIKEISDWYVKVTGKILDEKLTQFREDFINDLYQEEYNANRTKDTKNLEIGEILNQPEPEDKPVRKIFGFNLD